MRILLTGSTGFLGKVLATELINNDVELIEIGRNDKKKNNRNYIYTEALDSDSQFNLDAFICDIAIHCAARVHIMNDSSSNSLEKFREVNTYGTLNLAQQAADAGVKRFIFISSIKVNGESTEPNIPFKADDYFIPTDPYGLSKYEAEIGLRKIAQDTGMEVVIIRPPLVYGPGVKANFASMMKWMNKGLPLPLGGIKKNKRSLVSVDNLVNLIITCIAHPKAANQTFLVSDDDDVSTSQLLSNMSIALDAPNRLLPISSSWLTLAAKLIGKPAISQKLCGSLQVDISKTKQLLNWNPPYTMGECLAQTAKSFIKKNEKNIYIMNNLTLRILDFVIAFFGLIATFPILIIVTIIGYFDTKSPIFIQQRVGKNKQPFNLIKFRTMSVDTKSVASHLASSASITKLGGFLRKTKIDELPQLINVLKGEMSFVGPRPNLFNQEELINERDSRGVYDVLPGITGLAQVSTIDMSTPKLLAETDQKMIETFTLKNYFKYILQTVTGSGSGDRVG